MYIGYKDIVSLLLSLFLSLSLSCESWGTREGIAIAHFSGQEIRIFSDPDSTKISTYLIRISDD